MSKSRRQRTVRPLTPADRVLDADDATLVDVLDRLLDKGVVVNGDLVMGVAGVDLIYLRLSALLSAIDRVMPYAPSGPSGSKRHERREHSGPRPLKRP